MTLRDRAIEMFADELAAFDLDEEIATVHGQRMLDALLAFLDANGLRVVQEKPMTDILTAGSMFAEQWRAALNAAPNPLAKDAP